MSDLSTQRHRAIQPQQARSRQRFDNILQAASEQLLRRGFDGFNMSELAEELGYTRASIYKFFPTPQALFNELNSRQLDLLESALGDAAQKLQSQADWRLQLRQVVSVAAQFHNTHPLARMLILGASPGEQTHRSLQSTIQRLGEILRGILDDYALPLSREPVDQAMVAVEIGTACLRCSFYLHDHISEAYTQTASDAIIAYLERAVP